MPDAAGGAGDQHPFPKQRRAVPQRPQRGEAGDRQCRGLLEKDIVGQCRHAVGRHCGALCPSGIVGQCDDARARLGPTAVGRRLNHDSADVLTGPPTFRADLKQPQFATVERKRAHLDDRLVRRRLRLGDLAQFDRRGAAGYGDQSQHQLPPGSAPVHLCPSPSRFAGPSLCPQAGRGSG
ncbi:MAG: hypothetical protein E6K32_20105 [Gammaproteobacteria bacterium]|nr:MAG: hypothetical protein E6K32_20105 [Gammaproteobacteria bacterium]